MNHILYILHTMISIQKETVGRATLTHEDTARWPTPKLSSDHGFPQVRCHGEIRYNVTTARAIW